MFSARRRRHLFLVALAVTGYGIGIPLSRLLDSSRGVVLDHDGARAYVAYPDRMPRWVRLPEVAPGDVVAKARGAWRTEPCAALGRDMQLMQLYDRYHAAYRGNVVRIEPGEQPGTAAAAIVETAQGRHVRVSLSSAPLREVTVGDRLHKMPQTWDPEPEARAQGQAGGGRP